MPKPILTTLNLGGILLVLIGVFAFSNALSGKNLVIGNLKFAGGEDVGMFLIALGLILFALSFVASKIFRKKF